MLPQEMSYMMRLEPRVACLEKMHAREKSMWEGQRRKEFGFFEEQKESYWIIVNRGEKVEGKVISWAGAHHVVP